jgi:general secretion pathway protein G
LSNWKKSRRRCRGLTLIEVVVIVAIVMTLTVIGIPAYDKYRENTRIAQAVIDIRTIEHDILIHEGYAGRLPDSLREVGKEYARDAWGNTYRYFNVTSGQGNGVRRFDKLAVALNTDFDLYSLGRDGKTDASLSNTDSLDDIVRGRNGNYVGLASKY